MTKMKRFELLEILVDDIVRRIDANSPLSQEWKDQYSDERSVKIEDAILWCDDNIVIEPYKSIIHYLRNFVNSADYDRDDELEVITMYTLSVSNNEARKKKIRGVFTRTNPYVCTLEVFYNEGNFSLADSNWGIWERIWASIGNNAEQANEFWTDLLNDQRSRIYVHTDTIENINEDKIWKLYSFAYLSYINEGKFSIPSILRAADLSPMYASLVFDERAKYDQFFDVYDVLNEVKHAEDLLTRFVKVYQVIELLAYRKKFQKLIKEHMDHHYPIVRQIESLTESFKKSEKEEISNLFTDCFSTIANKLDEEVAGAYPARSTYLSWDCRQFIQEYYKINFDGTAHHPLYDSKTVGLIVYQIRCSIVHNKETEVHFTFNNMGDYVAIVPLIEKLNTLLLENIIELINNGEKLKYTADTLPLY